MSPRNDRTADSPRLPAQVCLRVTRYCNSRCVFCLAPPDGSHPGQHTLAARAFGKRLEEWRLE